MKTLAAIAAAVVLAGCQTAPTVRFLGEDWAPNSTLVPPNTWAMHSVVRYGDQLSEGVRWPFDGKLDCERWLRPTEDVLRAIGGQIVSLRCRPIHPTGKGI